MKFKPLLFLFWSLVILAGLILRYQFALIASWPRDQAAFLWLSMNCAFEGIWPPVSMVTSTGIYNPNGAILFGALLSYLPGGIITISLALSFLQVFFSGLMVYYLPSLKPSHKLLLFCLILSNPYITAYSIDFWMSWSLLVFGCAFIVLLIHLLKNKSGSILSWFFLMLIAFSFPSIYIGHITFLGALVVLLIYLKVRQKISLDKNFWLGTLTAFTCIALLSIVPYFLMDEARNRVFSEIFSGFHERVFDHHPRDGDHILRALTHPWKLLFDPRHFFWYSNLKIISPETETGFLGSYRTLSYLTALLIGASFIAYLWNCLKTKSFLQPLETTPLAQPLMRYLFALYALILTFFFFLPSKFFYNEAKGTGYLIFLWLFVFYLSLSTISRFSYGKKILPLGFTLLIVCQLLLTHNITRDHLDYEGNYVSWADVPLIDRTDAMAFIASNIKNPSGAKVGYDFFHGNREKIEKETLYYAKKSQLGSLAAGRLYDCELWMRHGIKNQNPHLLERDHPDNDFLVTWSFVEPRELKEPWQNLPFKDFGRVRVFFKELRNHH